MIELLIETIRLLNKSCSGVSHLESYIVGWRCQDTSRNKSLMIIVLHKHENFNK